MIADIIMAIIINYFIKGLVFKSLKKINPIIDGIAKLINHNNITAISTPDTGWPNRFMKNTTAKALIPNLSKLEILGINVLAAKTQVALAKINATLISGAKIIARNMN
jgi:hypothetical protein